MEQERPKWSNLSICSLIQGFSQDRLVSFFYILREVEEPWLLRTDGVEFFGKILACPKADQKAQNDLICSFVCYYSIFYRIGSLFFFLYFAWSWGTISTQNWWSRIFWKKSCLPKSRLKGPKWPNLSICPLLQHFSQDWVISSVIFCVKLRDHKYSKLTGLNFLGKFSLAQKWAKKVQNGLLCVFLRYDSTFFTIDSLFFFFFFDILHKVLFNDTWFIYQEPYFSRKHVFHKKYRVDRTQDYK